MGRVVTLRIRAVAIATVLAAALVGVTVAAGHARGRPAVRAQLAAQAQPAARCVVPGTRRTIDQLWRPDMSAAIAYARGRVGDIAFAVRTQDHFYGYRPDHDEWSASVVKAMLLVTYLDSEPVRDRALTARDTAVLGPMIRISDNDDAQIIFDTVGQAGLSALARQVGMTHFATNPVWGETQVTPRDQTRFFLHIDGYVVARHRSYAMRLLRSISPADRWGIGELPLPGWKLYFKGGWGYGTGLEDHQVVLLARGCARVSLAVLTMYDGSHPYGKATLKGIFARLLRGFPTETRSHAVDARGVGRVGGVGGAVAAGGHRPLGARAPDRRPRARARLRPAQAPARRLHPRQRVRRDPDPVGTRQEPGARRRPAVAGARDEPGRDRGRHPPERSRGGSEPQLPLPVGAGHRPHLRLGAPPGLRARDPRGDGCSSAASGRR